MHINATLITLCWIPQIKLSQCILNLYKILVYIYFCTQHHTVPKNWMSISLLTDSQCLWVPPYSHLIHSTRRKHGWSRDESHHGCYIKTVCDECKICCCWRLIMHKLTQELALSEESKRNIEGGSFKNKDKVANVLRAIFMSLLRKEDQVLLLIHAWMA